MTTNRKICHFEVSSTLILYNNESFLNWIVMCNNKWILYGNTEWLAQWLVQEEAPKHFPKPNLHQKKKKGRGVVIVTVLWSVAGLIHYSFLNSSETIASEKSAQQIDEMYQKLQYLQPPLVNRKGPVLLCNYAQLCITQQTIKSWMNWATEFCLICHIHRTYLQLTTTNLTISTTFCRENASISRRTQEMLSKCSVNSEAWIFIL